MHTTHFLSAFVAIDSASIAHRVMRYTSLMKASHASEVKSLLDIPNIGQAMVRDCHILGIYSASDFVDKDPYKLYALLSHKKGKRQDPCVLDTLIAVVQFVNGAPALPWYHYTEMRKKMYKV